MRIRINSDSTAFGKKLALVAQKQVQFAAAVAATKTAVVVRDDYVLRDYKRHFNVRNRAFQKIVHNVAAADSKYARMNNKAVASIKRRDGPKVQGTTRRAEKAGKGPSSTDFMIKHHTGGTKLPIGGQALAIPLTDSVITRRKSGAKAGAVNKTYEPKTLYGSGKAFSVETRKGAFLVRRMARGNLQFLYSYKKHSRIKKRYNPFPEAQRGVMLHYERLFRRELVKALKTARIR